MWPLTSDVIDQLHEENLSFMYFVNLCDSHMAREVRADKQLGIGQIGSFRVLVIKQSSTNSLSYFYLEKPRVDFYDWVLTSLYRVASVTFGVFHVKSSQKAMQKPPIG